MYPYCSLKKLPLRSKDLLEDVLRGMRAFLFPPKCLVCGNFFQPPDKVQAVGIPAAGSRPETEGIHPQENGYSRFLEPFLCPACMSGLTAIKPPVCACCGIMFTARHGGDHLCGDCITAPKYFSMARAPLVYVQTVIDLIHRYKYAGKIQLAGPLGAVVLTAFASFWPKRRIDIVIPVPLHVKKFRQRGFNQSFLLINRWKKLWPAFGVPGPAIEIVKDALTRIRSTDPQTGLGRGDRFSNIKGAFAVHSRAALENKRVLLIDDVYTTGATVNECARTLLDAGATSVDILTLARAH